LPHLHFDVNYEEVINGFVINNVLYFKMYKTTFNMYARSGFDIYKPIYIFSVKYIDI
jgi:hypothetical protein